MKLNTKGFSVVEAGLVLVIVGIIGFAGWKVWDVQQQTDKPEQQATTSSLPSSEPADQVNQFLELKDVGLKLELTDEIKDAYAYTSTDEFTGGGVYISTRYFDDKQGFEDCRAGMFDGREALGLVAIDSGKIGEDYIGTSIDETFVQNVNAVEKDGTYYWIVKGNGACWDMETVSDTDPNLTKLQASVAAFTTAKLSVL
jgi:hypothetical protein